MAGGLLNPQTELDGARRIIQLASSRLENLDKALTETVLEREAYLQKIGAAQELRNLIEDMNETYRRLVNK